MHVVQGKENNIKEVISYLPSTVFDPSFYEKSIPKIGYNSSKSAISPELLNDGTPVMKEMCSESKEKSKVFLVGSTGKAGRSIYALNLTDVDNPGSANIIGEYSHANDPQLGYTVHPAILAYDNLKHPIAIVGSGYNTDDSVSDQSYIYIFRLDNGSFKTPKKIMLPKTGKGLGAITMVDKNLDGIPEALYVGDVKGQIWRVNYIANTDSWEVAYNNQPYFQAVDENNKPQPVTGGVAVYNNYIYFGTGKMLSKQDFDKNAQTVYGIKEHGSAPIGTSLTANLLTQEYVVLAGKHTTTQTDAGTIYQVTNKPIDTNSNGWRLNLRDYYLSIDVPEIVKNRGAVKFTLFAPAPVDVGQECASGGKTSVLMLKLFNGGQLETASYDTNLDNALGSEDINGAELAVDSNSGFSTLITGPNGMLYVAVSDKNGNITTIAVGKTSPVVRRLSWRILN